MPHRVFLITAIIFCFFQPLTAQQSAWDLLLSENPEAADDRSIGWQDRLILHALTPEQAQSYFSGRVSAEELILENGQILARFLEEKLNPEAHVYIPLPTPCPLFDLQEPLAAVQRLQSQGSDLSMQGGSASGCAISEEAAALLIQVQVESLGSLPARVKLWSPEGPEPTLVAAEETIFEFPLSYETTLVVPVCTGESCPPGEFEMKMSEAAAIGGSVVGYFRPLATSDQPRGLIPLATEGSSNNFFGTGAGANNSGTANSFFGGDAGNANTTGVSNSFFGKEAGLENTTGSANSFFGQRAGESNTTGLENSFFGSDAGRSNTDGHANSFFGALTGFDNTTGSENSFFGQRAGSNNTTGSENSFFGQEAGFFNTTGFNNSSFGHDSGRSNTTGFANSFLGSDAGKNNKTGCCNSFFGRNSGLSNTDENFNTFIGHNTNGLAGITNATAIGASARVRQSNSLVLGSIRNPLLFIADVNVGIGTDTPQTPLHVKRSDGTVQIIRAQSTGPEAIRNMMDLINNGIPQFRLVDTSADGNNWQFSNTNSGLNISLQGSGVQEFLIEDDGDVFIKGTVQVTSSRASKENFKAIDSEEILKRIAALDISEWNYIKDADSVRHIGPVSEDFHALFGLGDGDKHITPTDLSGIALAAIKGLMARLESEANKNRRLGEELAELRRRVEDMKTLEARLERLEALVAVTGKR